MSILTQCGREAEEGAKFDREQQTLCRQVQDGAECFELLSLKLSGIKNESSSTDESSDYYARFLRYMAARTALHGDILHIKLKTACFQDKLRLREAHRANEETAKNLSDLRAATNEKQNTLTSLQNFDWSALERSVAEKQKHMDDLTLDTAELQRSDVEDKRKLQDDNIAALEVKAKKERHDSGTALNSAQTFTAACVARAKHRENALVSVNDDLIAAKADCDASEDALSCAQQHHKALCEKSVELKEEESRAESVLKDARSQLREARDLEKNRCAEEEFVTRQLSLIQPAEADDDEPRAPSMESANLLVALDAQRATVATIDREIAALTTQPDGDIPGDLHDIAGERERLEARLVKARADTAEHLRVKDELEASCSTKSRLSSEVVREQNELAVINDRLLIEVQGLQARVQAIVDQIETAPATSRAVSGASSQLDERIKDLERQHAHVENSLRKAEERRAKDETEPSQQQQDLDTARARRYIADSLAERQRELQTLSESVAAADKEFQSLVNDGECKLKAEQSKLKDVMDGIEARRRQFLTQIEVVEKEIESLGGGDELGALDESCNEEKASSSAAPAMPPTHAGAINRGTPPEDSWATSAPAQFGSNFASGLEDESEELLEAQRLRELEVATKKPTVADVTRGRGRGRQRI